MTAPRLLVTVSVLALAISAAGAEPVGNVGAVNPSARGTPPGGAARTLTLGLGVQNRERIDTNEHGNAQIVFVDKSTMTVGRNSSVTVDHFVYSGGTGSQGVSLARGVLRFIGGSVSHEEGAQIKTPTASIGIRGGSALFEVGGPCGTLVVLQYGVVTVSSAQGAGSLNRPGYAVCAPIDAPLSAPFLAPPDMIARLTASLSSARGQTGGAGRPPTDKQAAPILTVGPPPNDVDGPGLDFLGTVWSGNAIVQSGANANNQPAPPPPPPPPEDTRNADLPPPYRP